MMRADIALFSGMLFAALLKFGFMLRRTLTWTTNAAGPEVKWAVAAGFCVGDNMHFWDEQLALL